jgi:hypothetical protein
MSPSEPTDAFALLELPRRLSLAEAEVLQAHHAAVLKASGDSAMQGRLHEAREVLIDHPRRIRHWLELAGWSQWQAVPLSESFMASFGRLGPVLHESLELARQLEASSTALGRARLAARVLGLRQRLEACAAELEALKLPMLESLAQFDQLSLEQQTANLGALAMEQARWAYLGKWQAQIQQAVGRLFF